MTGRRRPGGPSPAGRPHRRPRRSESDRDAAGGRPSLSGPGPAGPQVQAGPQAPTWSAWQAGPRSESLAGSDGFSSPGPPGPGRGRPGPGAPYRDVTVALTAAAGVTVVLPVAALAHSPRPPAGAAGGGTAAGQRRPSAAPRRPPAPRRPGGCRSGCSGQWPRDSESQARRGAGLARCGAGHRPARGPRRPGRRGEIRGLSLTGSPGRHDASA